LSGSGNSAILMGMVSHKKQIAGVLSAAFLVWLGHSSGIADVSFGVQKAFAAETPSNAIFTDMTVLMSTLISMVNFLSVVIYPLINRLLDPNFFLKINGANDAVINRIWMTSRDIMNVLFAFLLIGGACMTVVTAKKDIIDKYAAKFLLGIVLVNFSWFFPRVILDVGNVFTATVYKLPQMTGQACKNSAGGDCKFPVEWRYLSESEEAPQGDGWRCDKGSYCVRTVPLESNANSAQGILAGLIFNHTRLPELAVTISSQRGGNGPNQLGQLNEFIRFILSTGLTLALSLTLFLAMLALMVAFIIRIPILWITMAFMPFMFVGFVAGPIAGKFDTMEILKKFVKAAFLPAVTAIPITVGFIVVNALVGTPDAEVNEIASELLKNVGFQIQGVPNLWLLLWQIMAILIVWKGVFMALSIDQIYEDATKGIRGAGGGIGKLVASLPLNIPFIPTGKKGADNKPVYASAGEARELARGALNLSQRGGLNKKNLDNLLGEGNTNVVQNTAQNIKNSPVINSIQSNASAQQIATAIANDQSLQTKLKNLNSREIADSVNLALKSRGVTLSDQTLEALRKETFTPKPTP